MIFWWKSESLALLQVTCCLSIIYHIFCCLSIFVKELGHVFVYFGLSTMKDNDNQSLCFLPEMRKLPGDFKSFVFFLPFVLIFFSIGITIFIFICFYLDFKDSPLMVIFLFYINENVLNNRIIELLRNKKIKRDVVLL